MFEAALLGAVGGDVDGSMMQLGSYGRSPLLHSACPSRGDVTVAPGGAPLTSLSAAQAGARQTPASAWYIRGPERGQADR